MLGPAFKRRSFGKTALNRTQRWLLVNGPALLIFGVAVCGLGLRLAAQIDYQRAVAFNRIGSHERAVRLLERALSRIGKDSEVWRELGDAFYRLGTARWDEGALDPVRRADAAFRSAARLNPLDAESVFGIARTVSALERLQRRLDPAGVPDTPDALPYFQEAVRLRPNGIRYRWALARYFSASGRDRDLMDQIETLTRIYPRAYDDLKKETFWSPMILRAAMAGLRRAVIDGIDPKNAHRVLSQASVEKGDLPAAIAHYQAYLDHPPETRNVQSLFHLGRLYLDSGQPDPAEDRFVQALTLSPAPVHSLERLYPHYRAKGSTEAFVKVCLRLSAEVGGSDRVQLMAVRAMVDLGDLPGATAALDRMILETPTAEAYFWKSRVFEAELDWDGMELAIQKATVLDPENSRYHLDFSRVLHRQGKLYRSEQAAGLAIRYAADPSPALYHHRALIRWDRRDWAGAARDWQAAAGLAPENNFYRDRSAEALVKASRQGGVVP